MQEGACWEKDLEAALAEAANEKRGLPKAEAKRFYRRFLQLPPNEQERISRRLGFLPEPDLLLNPEVWQTWWEEYRRRTTDPRLADGL